MEVSTKWSLKKYARRIETQAGTVLKGNWQHFDNTAGDLILSLSSCDHLFLSQKEVVHESYVLSVCSQWMRGVSRGDSLLVLSKVQNDHRQFRIQFSSTPDQNAIDQCSSCVAKLASYFPIKRTSVSDVISASQTFTQSQTSEPPTQMTVPPTEEAPTQTVLTGETSLADVARCVLNPSQYLLPLAYQQSNLPKENLEELIWLCLSDSNFPHFVDEVDRVLKDITEDEPA